MSFLFFEDDEYEILYSAMDRFQIVFNPYVLPNGKMDIQKLSHHNADNKNVVLLIDNNLTSPICEIARHGYLKDTDHMIKVSAFVTWTKSIGARLSCGLSLFETDSQN